MTRPLENRIDKPTITDRVLDYITEHGEGHVGSISEATGLLRTQVSSSLGSLASRGYVVKTPETVDLGGRIPANVYAICEPPRPDTTNIVERALANRPALEMAWAA